MLLKQLRSQCNDNSLSTPYDQQSYLFGCTQVSAASSIVKRVMCFLKGRFSVQLVFVANDPIVSQLEMRPSKQNRALIPMSSLFVHRMSLVAAASACARPYTYVRNHERDMEYV